MLHIHFDMTGQTKAFISSNLVTVLSDLFSHIFVNLTITVVPIAILNFTSSVQSASLAWAINNFPRRRVLFRTPTRRRGLESADAARLASLLRILY